MAGIKAIPIGLPKNVVKQGVRRDRREKFDFILTWVRHFIPAGG